jgi:Na+/melibiose symporter-like transporter
MRSILRRPDFRLLFGGLVASMIGESILLLALAIWVKDLTDSNGMAGATIFAIAAPMVLAPLVGWVADRFRRRPFLIAANIGIAAALTPLYAVRTAADVWIIYLVSALYGLSYVAISAALNGLIKEVVTESQLAEANGALQTVKQGLRLIGPLIGAGLYAGVGGWPLAAIGAAGFLIAAGAVFALRVTEERPKPPELHWLGEATAGMRYLARQAALRRTTIGVALAVLLVGFGESVFFAYVDDGLHRDPAFLGVLVSVQGIGGLLGGLIAARVVRAVGEIAAAAIGVALLGVTNFAFVYPSLILAVPATVLFGAGIPLGIVGFYTLLQRVTPPELIGRVSGATEMIIAGPQALSIGVGALLVALVDYRILFAVMGLGVTLAGWYLWVARGLTMRSGATAPGAVDASGGGAGGAEVVEPLLDLDDRGVGQR